MPALATPGSLLSAASKDLQSNLGKVFTIMLPVFAATAAFSLYAQGGDPGSLLIGIVLAVAGAVLSVWAQLALLYLAKDSTGEASQLYTKAKTKIALAVVASLWAGAFILGGLILLIIPGIIFAVWYSLIVPVVAFEDTTGKDALDRSKSYVQGRWGSVFGRWVVLGIATVAAQMIVRILTGGNNTDPGTVSLLVDTALSAFVLAPLAAFYTFRLYQDLKSNPVTT